MLRRRYTWVALILIIAIAIICVAPSVDLDPTALRAWQAACAMLLAMATVFRSIAPVSTGSEVSFFQLPSWFNPFLSMHALSEVRCPLLC